MLPIVAPTGESLVKIFPVIGLPVVPPTFSLTTAGPGVTFTTMLAVSHKEGLPLSHTTTHILSNPLYPGFGV